MGEHFQEVRTAMLEGSHKLREDGIYQLWSTPQGEFWYPGPLGSLDAFVLAEEQFDIYRTYRIKPGAVVLDCGANVGTFTRRALNRGAAKVVAIEINPESAEAMRRTFAKEIGEGRVVVYPKGVWDQETSLDLRADSVVLPRNGSSRRLPVTTIDQIVAELHLPSVDFIKMDIEGAEKNALRGAKATLAKFSPTMAISAEHLPDDAERIPALVSELVPGRYPDEVRFLRVRWTFYMRRRTCFIFRKTSVPRTSDRDADAPEAIGNRLAKVEPALAPGVARLGRARRSEHVHPLRFEHLLNAVDMVAVAHHNAGLQIHAAHDFGGRRGAFDGAGPLGFRENRFRGDAVAAQVSPSHLALGERRIAAGSAGGQDARRPSLPVEKQGMVQPGFQNGRGIPMILGRAQNQNDVGRPHFVDGGLQPDVVCHSQHLGQREGCGHPQKNHRDPCECPSHLTLLCRTFRIIVVDSLSDKNPLVKQIRRAVSRGTLTEDGYAVAEGAHLLEEALAAKCEVAAVIVAESAHVHYPQARMVSDKSFRELSSTETPQGVIALVRPPQATLAQMLRHDTLVVVLDGVQDPGNAGAIVRAAEAFGASGVVFLKGTVNPYNPKCMRGSAGSAFRVPLVASLETDEVLKHTQIAWYAAMPRARKLVRDADLIAPCGIVIGSEGQESAQRWLGVRQACESRRRSVESLNAAVAAGILLYEACRQRGNTR